MTEKSGAGQLEPGALWEIAAAMVETNDVLPPVRGPDRRVPGSDRNLDRAATLVAALTARGFVVMSKKERDADILAIRNARAALEEAADTLAAWDWTEANGGTPRWVEQAAAMLGSVQGRLLAALEYVGGKWDLQTFRSVK